MKTALKFLFMLTTVGLMSCGSQAESNANTESETTQQLESNPTGQSGVQDSESAPNIVQTAVGSKDHTTLVTAVKAAGLVDALSNAGPFTVFAPTNAAFATFLSANGFANLDSVPVPLLQKVLLNHVLGAKKMAADITTGYVKTIGKYGATSSYIDMYLSKTTGVKINGESNVTTADVEATNGVIHVIGKVLLPK